jgi:hypothetical protein
VLDNIPFQDVVGHAKRLALWIELFLLTVVAIVACQVAYGADWLGENLKLARDFGQIWVSL